MHLLEILLVEDNPGDIRLLREAFKESGLIHHLNVVSDGIEALSLLRKTENYSEVAPPDIILLDINLPRKNGLEILEEIKANHELKEIPVIILTSSDRDLDVLIAYKKQASAYLVKPTKLDQFDEVITAIVTLCE